MRRILVPQRISTSCPLPTQSIINLTGETMGTEWSVRYAGKPDEGLRNKIQQEVDGVVNQMSHWLGTSDISRFNQAAPKTWHQLPQAFFMVLSAAINLCRDSRGAYNPASGSLVNLWGFGAENTYKLPGFVGPSNDEVLRELNKITHHSIRLNYITNEVYQPGGLYIDLSSIAKGYAVDQIVVCLKQNGIEHCLVEIGGELYGAGMKPDGQPWWVTFELPPINDNQALHKIDETVIALHELAIATSGDYRRYFLSDGMISPHTIDPRTGYPINNNIASVTVIHTSCMMADALSTTLTVLGAEEGLRFAEERQLIARFIIRSNDGFREVYTRQFAEMLQ